MTCRVVL